MRTLKITRDSSASVKILKELETAGRIKMYDVMLENGRENTKVKEKILPVAVWDHARWGEAVLAGDDCTYDEIRQIIGSEHVKDAMQLEAHIRNQHDYFVTEDTDFLTKMETLNKKFNVEIVTPEELVSICNQLH